MQHKDASTPSPVFEMILESTQSQSGPVLATPSRTQASESWHVEHQEGQLSVDVGETEQEVVVATTMAGADTKKIEVYVHNDLLTIRGERAVPAAFSSLRTVYHQECFWGNFSRTIVLPVDVKADLANAEYTNGVLVVRIPKRQVEAKIPITIVEE